MHRSTALVLVLLVMACEGRSQATFPQELADTSCEKLEECDLMPTGAEDAEECAESMLAGIEATYGSDNCRDFDQEAANACLDAYLEEGCDLNLSACEVSVICGF